MSMSISWIAFDPKVADAKWAEFDKLDFKMLYNAGRALREKNEISTRINEITNRSHAYKSNSEYFEDTLSELDRRGKEIPEAELVRYGQTLAQLEKNLKQFEDDYPALDQELQALLQREDKIVIPSVRADLEDFLVDLADKDLTEEAMLGCFEDLDLDFGSVVGCSLEDSWDVEAVLRGLAEIKTGRVIEIEHLTTADIFSVYTGLTVKEVRFLFENLGRLSPELKYYLEDMAERGVSLDWILERLLELKTVVKTAKETGALVLSRVEGYPGAAEHGDQLTKIRARERMKSIFEHNPWFILK